MPSLFSFSITGASVVEPTLEDVFLYYFGEKGGEME